MIGIVRGPDASTALDHARRLTAAGLGSVEISLTTPGALRAIEEASKVGFVGAGTVLDGHQAAMTISAGARFLVCPTLSEDVIRTAHRHGVPVVAGAATPTEIVQALEAGADLVKLFPASQFAPADLKAIVQAVPHAPLVPTGGVSLASAASWLEAGAVAVGMGGELVRTPEEEVRAFLTSLRTP
ncbi:2-dehydro-3-deoxyphosphogluconate aldolase [Actinomadura harenae]|uniref:2-dehydro-3-deoxyphosphogluconate aldolase n=1 Tax=Actinomadura harenae TaxID=2483351 RepID=A0A3M2M072_9ACTN|nr:2-dehydro-3-deoxyphosphogluconate aldolase [Actinomadura harenae]